ncbi:hypothetical protein EST38_g2259 [Candolleomyces aberdarensis]|uniref:Uncharacterized protein n=1 Tax=Candolleomyces aberdarensis TaxID=2316362 RepID=A0A4Q2DTQ6_9AGAR|nr:hypothetical protein EST38_g2259 [Candolleomyces aberdarensis]
MSVSIDDLVSSFSSSHIGQESSDLALLQMQLAEALLGGSSSFASSSRFVQRGREVCTTPTARTPSTSTFNWDSINPGYRSRSSSISGPSRSTSNVYEDAEDELMVEELLMPASPSASTFENSHSMPFMQRTPSSASHSYHQTPTPSASSNFDAQTTSSHFTSSDPFYLQAQANSQSYFYSNSNITQHGCPNVSSPFVAAAATQFHGYQYQHPMHSAMGVVS